MKKNKLQKYIVYNDNRDGYEIATKSGVVEAQKIANMLNAQHGPVAKAERNALRALKALGQHWLLKALGQHWLAKDVAGRGLLAPAEAAAWRAALELERAEKAAKAGGKKR